MSKFAGIRTIIGAWSSNLAPGYHTYGVDWEKQSVTWYVDGKCVPAPHPTATQKCFSVVQNVPAQPMYLIANFAIDGNAIWHNARHRGNATHGVLQRQVRRGLAAAVTRRAVDGRRLSALKQEGPPNAPTSRSRESFGRAKGG